MAIDPSIFSNVSTPQINMPSPLATAQQAMTLNQLGMNQAMMARQFQTQAATRQAYADNTDQNGNLDRQGFLSELGKNPLTAQSQMQYANQFAANDKAQAEAQSAKLDAVQKAVNITGPSWDYMAQMSPDQRAAAYPGIVKQLAANGVDTSNMPDTYEPDFFHQAHDTWTQSKASLENQLTQAQIGKTQAETAQVGQMEGAKELDNFNKDVNNASSRTTTGQLMQARDRAARVQTLLNSGAPQNETPDQRVARLNQLMPQIGTEVSTSLASIMQGGVPDEAIQKELSPTTIQSTLASLQQKFTANPTAANQGALLNAYGDVAQKLGNFSSNRLQQISDRARAAYPYAQKYFPDKMDQIAAPLTTPGASPAAQAPIAQSNSGGIFPSAQAATTPQAKVGPSASDNAALQWLKTADPSNPTTFQVRAKLKAKGLL